LPGAKIVQNLCILDSGKILIICESFFQNLPCLMQKLSKIYVFQIAGIDPLIIMGTGFNKMKKIKLIIVLLLIIIIVILFLNMLHKKSEEFEPQSEKVTNNITMRENEEIPKDYQKTPINALNLEEERVLLRKILKNAKNYLEFGSGGSTFEALMNKTRTSFRLKAANNGMTI
jgi:hypothetical protein